MCRLIPIEITSQGRYHFVSQMFPTQPRQGLFGRTLAFRELAKSLIRYDAVRLTPGPLPVNVRIRP